MNTTDMPTAVDSEHFKAWTAYWGELHTHHDDLGGKPGTSIVYGWECLTPENAHRRTFTTPRTGAVYGFVQTGSVWITTVEASTLPTPGRHVLVEEGMWFVAPFGLAGSFETPGRVVAVQRWQYRAPRAFGGPIEELGRLRYIDRCSDSLLVAPQLLGDPCLNHLHFPPNIDQTEHTHPSLRAGIVARGEGWCETPLGKSRLEPGVVFSIPQDGRHNFLTDATHEMDIIAWHPDSDWGPTHTDHPMVNRTWVDGRKVDNSGGVHVTAPFVRGDLRD